MKGMTRDRSIKAIFNPTLKEINELFGMDVSDKMIPSEKCVTASRADNRDTGIIHFSMTFTNNKSEIEQNKKIVAWRIGANDYRNLRT